MVFFRGRDKNGDRRNTGSKAVLHLLPLPGFVVGEWLKMNHRIDYRQSIWIFAALAATPLLDMSAGGWVIFPIYEQLVSIISSQ